MSAILEITRRVTVRTGDQNQLDYGSITTPISSTTVAGLPISGPRTITLAAGESKKLWDYEDDGEFALLAIEADAYIEIAEKVDAPTAADDPTASGTAVNYPKTGVSCIAPHYIQGMATPRVASSSNYAAAPFHASTAAGRRYEVWARNPSEDTDATVTFLWTK